MAEVEQVCIKVTLTLQSRPEDRRAITANVMPLPPYPSTA
jgi:hypothetical protein